MAFQIKILIIEDSDDDVQLLLREIKKAGYDPVFVRVDTAADLEKALDQGDWDVILSDYTMPHFDAPHALEIVQKRGIDVPFIVVTGSVGEEIAVDLVIAGANDYIMKTNLKRLIPAIERECRQLEMRRWKKQAEEKIRISDESYRMLANDIPGIVYRVFCQEKNRMEFYNAMLEDLTGYRKEELRQGEVCSIDPIIIPQDRDRVLEEVEQAVKQHQPFTIEYRINTKGGTIRHFKESGRPVYDEHNKVLYIDGVIFDITAEKKTEAELRSKINDLQNINDLAIERELKIMELQKELNELRQEKDKK